MCETKTFIMAILHWEQGLLCDKKNDDFQFDDNGRKFSKRVENNV